MRNQMSDQRRLRPRLFPRLEMPSDPVKAVTSFFYWLLQVLVRFFWVFLLIATVYEFYQNGIVGGIVIFFVFLGLWLALAILLAFLKISTGISRTISDMSTLQQEFLRQSSGSGSPFFAPSEEPDPEPESRIVEGSVIDLDEERRKRHSE